MRQTLVVLIIIICSSTVFSQDSNSDCYEFMHFKQNENFCDTINLTTGAKLYYQWNCDSTWLTFENKEKVILKSCSDIDPILCSRVDLNFIKEYPNYLLFRHKWTTTSFTPPDMVFINKDNGKEINRIAKEQFVWGDSDKDYLLYFSDNTLNELTYLDHNTDNKHVVKFEDGKIQDLADKNQTIRLADFFKNFKKGEENFTFEIIVSNEEKEEIKIKIK